MQIIFIHLTQLSELKKCSIFSFNYKAGLTEHPVFQETIQIGFNRQKIV